MPNIGTVLLLASFATLLGAILVLAVGFIQGYRNRGRTVFTIGTYKRARNRLVNRMNDLHPILNSQHWKTVAPEWSKLSRFAEQLGDRARREKGIWLKKKIWRL